jgi:hypothetical protein
MLIVIVSTVCRKCVKCARMHRGVSYRNSILGVCKFAVRLNVIVICANPPQTVLYVDSN